MRWGAILGASAVQQRDEPDEADASNGASQVIPVLDAVLRETWMAGNRQAKRLAWFSKGVNALQRARPGAPKVYGCPLCIRGYEKAEALTVEDVPPRSVGGRPLVLTCGPCNHTSGYLLDANIRSGRDLQEMAAGTREAPIKLTQGNHTISARATFGPGGLLIDGVPEKSDPKAREALSQQLDRVAASGSTGCDFTITLSYRHHSWREAVGWLRVAYLFAFAALGYRFIMRPELEPLREQFREPNESVVPEVMKRTNETSLGDGIIFVHTPRELRSILVCLGCNLFFFPDFNHASDFYERIKRQPETPETLTINGPCMDLPREPIFAFDYEPSLIRLTAPLEG